MDLQIVSLSLFSSTAVWTAGFILLQSQYSKGAGCTYPFPPSAVLTCRIYPSLKSAIWTCRVYPFLPPAVWMCRMYPSTLPAVWTCRVYPSFPPVMWMCRMYPSTQPAVWACRVLLYPPLPSEVWTCRVYHFPPYAVWTWRVVPLSKMPKPEPVRYRNASVLDWNAGMPMPEASASMPMPSYDKDDQFCTSSLCSEHFRIFPNKFFFKLISVRKCIMPTLCSLLEKIRFSSWLKVKILINCILHRPPVIGNHSTFHTLCTLN